jgi:hypothetical protein
MMRMVVRHLGSVVACLAGVLSSTEHALAADESTQLPVNAAGVTLLRWAPPSLENPKTIELGARNTIPRLDPARDYILKMPTEPRTRATMIISGRNVVIIGGHIALPNLDSEAVADAERTRWKARLEAARKSLSFSAISKRRTMGNVGRQATRRDL